MIPLYDEEHKTHPFPIITVLLIAINVYVFFTSTSQAVVDEFGLHAGSLLAGRGLTDLVTSMFLHGGFLHLLFNMWSLWIFGDNVEGDLGKIKYIILYFASGIVGSYLFAVFADPSSIAIGASGAIAGVMGAYLILHPKNRINTLIPLGFFLTTARIPATIFIGLWFLLQFFGFYGGNSAVAYSAHIGGFVAGLILAVLLRERKAYSSI